MSKSATSALRKSCKKGLRPKPRSYYLFHFYKIDSRTGKRTAFRAKSWDKQYAHLINTTYHNPATGTNTLYMVQSDIDFDKVRDSKFIRAGRAEWEPIEKYLAEHHPYLLRYIFAVTRSFGGRGLCIAIALSPLELGLESTQGAERAAKALQKKIYDLFEKAGCGPDLSAAIGGLKRDCANWQNPKTRLYYRPEIKKQVQREKTPVVSELLDKLNKDPLLCYKRKKDQPDIYLYPHIKAEPKIAKLVLHLIEEDYSVWTSTTEIRELTGLSLSVVRKFLKAPPQWLETEWNGKAEGWRITLNRSIAPALVARAHVLAEGKQVQLCGQHKTDFTLATCKCPERVQDGERNTQITNWILRLKWLGISKEAAHQRVLLLSERIPNSKESKNCRPSEVKAKVRSIYGDQHHMHGLAPSSADYPRWLGRFEPLSKSTSRQKNTKFRRGGGSPPRNAPPSAGRCYRIGVDRHFQYRACSAKSKNGRRFWKYSYYSVGESVSKVFVVERGNRLFVYSEDQSTLFCEHSLLKEPGRYVTEPAHVEGFDAWGYVTWMEKRGLFARRDIERWKHLALDLDYKAVRPIQRMARKLLETHSVREENPN